MALNFTWAQAAHCVAKQSLVHPLASQLGCPLALVDDTAEAVLAADLLFIMLHEASAILETQRHCADCYINSMASSEAQNFQTLVCILQCKKQATLSL